MKKILGYILFTLAVVSCGDKRQTFLLEGSFKGFNQGELYIYGADGTRPLDTIAVVKGQFRYEIPLEDSTTFVLVFPNFSELPVFGMKGANVKINGDASHLREADISGTDENEDFTKFRQKTSHQTPPEFSLSVAQFIKENPTSPFAIYLMRKYYIQTSEPNYPKAIEVAEAILKANPDAEFLRNDIKRMEGKRYLKDGGRLPAFTMTDINGNAIKSSDLNAKLNVITVWSSWNYESQSIQRQLASKKEQYDSDLKILSICIDADVKNCRQKVNRDSLKWSTICDGKMWETPLLMQIGLSFVPDNIVTDKQGKILAHSLNLRDLMDKIDKTLEKKEE